MWTTRYVVPACRVPPARNRGHSTAFPRRCPTRHRKNSRLRPFPVPDSPQTASPKMPSAASTSSTDSTSAAPSRIRRWQPRASGLCMGAWHRHDLASLLAGEPRRDQRPGACRRLDDEYAARQPGHQSVAARKVVRERRRAQSGTHLTSAAARLRCARRARGVRPGRRGRARCRRPRSLRPARPARPGAPARRCPSRARS